MRVLLVMTFGRLGTGNGPRGLGGLEESLEVGKFVGPEDAVVVEPEVDGAKR